jgi:amidase
MCRTVADAAALLTAMGGADYTNALSAAALKGARLGVLERTDLAKHRVSERIFADALRILKDAGAELTDPISIPASYREVELDVLLYELKADLAAYLEASGSKMKSLADIIAFNEANADKEMPFFGQELFLMAEKKGPLTDPGYKKLMLKHRSARRGLEAALKKHKLDALVAPTGSPAWLIDHVNGDGGGGYSSTSLAAVAGTPSITVPAGQERGLPVGVSFMGAPRGEAKIIGLAYAFEQLAKARKPPDFRPTVAA